MLVVGAWMVAEQRLCQQSDASLEHALEEASARQKVRLALELKSRYELAINLVKKKRE